MKSVVILLITIVDDTYEVAVVVLVRALSNIISATLPLFHTNGNQQLPLSFLQ